MGVTDEDTFPRGHWAVSPAVQFLENCVENRYGHELSYHSYLVHHSTIELLQPHEWLLVKTSNYKPTNSGNFRRNPNLGLFWELRIFEGVKICIKSLGFVECYYGNEVSGAEASITGCSLLCFFSRQLLRRFSEDGLANSAANTAVAAGSMGVDPTLGTRIFPSDPKQNGTDEKKKHIPLTYSFLDFLLVWSQVDEVKILKGS